MLRYGVPVKTEAGKDTETVKVIDWDHPCEPSWRNGIASRSGRPRRR